MAAPTAARPTSARQRHDIVDALRGLALLGILVVNIEYIVQTLELGWADYTGTVDLVVRWLIVTFGLAKVYPLFALLFGYGLALQAARASGDGLGRRYRRRMIGLAVLGVAHGVLFFPGDILVIYAVIGLVAFRFRATETRRLLTIAGVLYGVTAVGWLLLGLLDLAGGGSSPSPASDEMIATLTNGSFADVVGVHAGNWPAVLAILSLVQGPVVFASFLAGIALGRTDLLSRAQDHLALARRVLGRAGPAGVVLAGLGATLTLAGDATATLGFAVGVASAPLLTASYVAGLVLALGRETTGTGPLSRLARASTTVLQAGGRMSLTLYLLESVVASTLAYGYGAGLFGRVSPLGGLALAVAIWAGLSAAAVGWLRIARFGPVEWALRSFTYRSRQPLFTR